MENKQLVNSVSLNVNDENPCIDLDLSIPVKLEKEELLKLKEKKEVDLGMVSFTEKTSSLIRQTAEEIRKELMTKL